MTTKDYVVLKEGFVLRKLRQPGEVVGLHPRQAEHINNVLLKSVWDKLNDKAKRKLAGTPEPEATPKKKSTKDAA